MTSTKPKYVFATNNAHKLEEVRQLLGDFAHILSLREIGIDEDIPENQSTLEGNALQKARWVASRCECVCFADDTGLEVEALGGEPGVRSARYAPGVGHDNKANMALLLSNLEGIDNRKARFRTVIALIKGEKETLFEGLVNGTIAKEPSGNGGFGYDPVFIPEGYARSFAELSADEKNSISHRGRAVRRLAEYLKSK